MMIRRFKTKIVTFVIAVFLALTAGIFVAPGFVAAYVQSSPSGGLIDTGDFITSSLTQLPHSTPSTGDVKLLTVRVEFADLKFSPEAMNAQEMRQAIFGGEDSTHDCYPFESTAAYFRRASFGNLRLDGEVFVYTSQKTVAEYEIYENGGQNFEPLLLEVMDALDPALDFSDFDSDGNGVVDGLLLSVPQGGDPEFWYGCTATFWYNRDRLWDNVTLEQFIINDAQPLKTVEGQKYLNQVVAHEIGHCLGLPDYYKYESADWEGMKGDAGHELMDDMTGDLSAFSKLMLGWLKTGQVKVFDSLSTEAQNFSLYPMNEPGGNCVIIFDGTNPGNYCSEYFILEYITPTLNNKDAFEAGGVRALHIEATQGPNSFDSSKKEFIYSNFGSGYVSDDGIRLMKLVNDGEGFFEKGDILSFGVKNFGFYSGPASEPEDPCIEISFGDAFGKAEITAQKLEETYLACFDDDGQTLLYEGYCYKNKPFELADAPDKTDERYIYDFSGWKGYESGMLADENDMVFVAEYEKTDRIFEYTFFDDDGRTVLKSGTGAYGTEIIAPDGKDKSDPGSIYFFTGFVGFKEGDILTADIQFKANYEIRPREYTYTFLSKNGKRVLKTETAVYGTVIYAPRNDMSFKGFQSGMKLTQNQTFVAAGLEPESYAVLGGVVAVGFIAILMTAVFVFTNMKKRAKRKNDKTKL